MAYKLLCEVTLCNDWCSHVSQPYVAYGREVTFDNPFPRQYVHLYIMYGSICQQGSQLIDVFQTARINLYVSPTSKACSCILFRLYLPQKYRSFQGSCAWTLPGWNNRSSLISSVMSDHNTFTIFHLVWLVISLLKQYRNFKYLETLLDWASGCTQSWNWIHANKWETILENFSRSLVESVFMSVRGSQGAENNTVHCRVSTGTNKVSWTWS